MAAVKLSLGKKEIHLIGSWTTFLMGFCTERKLKQTHEWYGSWSSLASGQTQTHGAWKVDHKLGLRTNTSRYEDSTQKMMMAIKENKWCAREIIQFLLEPMENSDLPDRHASVILTSSESYVVILGIPSTSCLVTSIGRDLALSVYSIPRPHSWRTQRIRFFFKGSSSFSSGNGNQNESTTSTSWTSDSLRSRSFHG